MAPAALTLPDMPRSAEQLLSDALRLPDTERLELLGSVVPEIDGSDRSDGEWIAELERRARAVSSGSPGLPWRDVRAGIERKLARK